MDNPGNQAVHFVQGQHHGGDYHGVFQLLLGHRCVEAFALAQRHHRLDIALADQVRIENLQAFGQFNALGAGDRFHVSRLGQQHTAGDAPGLADGGGLDGQWLAALGQHNAFVGRLGALDQLVAEHRRRQAHLPWRAATLVQPARIEVAGDEIGDDLRALAVIDGDFLVEVVEQVGGFVGTGTHRQNRQPSLERAAAQIHDARVGQGIAGQQQAGQGHAVDRGQADGEDDVVTVAGGYHQYPGLEQLHGVTHGARADDDLGHAPGFVVAGIEDLRAHQVGHVAGARRVEFRLVGDAAQQAEIAAAQ